MSTKCPKTMEHLYNFDKRHYIWNRRYKFSFFFHHTKYIYTQNIAPKTNTDLIHTWTSTSIQFQHTILLHLDTVCDYDPEFPI